MSKPTKRHIDAAIQILDDRFIALLGVDRLGACVQIVAQALDQAEREGMRRAATIIQEGFDKEVGASFRADGKPSKNDQCPHGHFMYEDCEACCVAAILSEANTNSPDTSPVEADKATGAVSSSPAPVAVPYPWQGRGFNPDSVG